MMYNIALFVAHLASVASWQTAPKLWRGCASQRCARRGSGLHMNLLRDFTDTIKAGGSGGSTALTLDLEREKRDAAKVAADQLWALLDKYQSSCRAALEVIKVCAAPKRAGRSRGASCNARSCASAASAARPAAKSACPSSPCDDGRPGESRAARRWAATLGSPSSTRAAARPE